MAKSGNDIDRGIEQLRTLMVQAKVTPEELKTAIRSVLGEMVRSIKLQATILTARELGLSSGQIKQRIRAIPPKRELLAKVVARADAIPTIIFSAHQESSGVRFQNKRFLKSAFIAMPRISKRLNKFVFTRKTNKSHPLMGRKEQIYEQLTRNLNDQTLHALETFDAKLFKKLGRKKGLF